MGRLLEPFVDVLSQLPHDDTKSALLAALCETHARSLDLKFVMIECSRLFKIAQLLRNLRTY
jgi:hypothetical protein